MIDLKNLETFIWVAQLGGFRLAAQRLHTTQPGISQRIAALENELGVKLFERDSRRVILTTKGRELIPYAEQMLRLRSEILDIAESHQAYSGNVRMGVSETIVHTSLIKLVEAIRSTYPMITLDIEVDVSRNLRENLLKGALDIVFLLGPIQEPNVCNFDLASYPLNWVASPKLQLHEKRHTLKELAHYPVITYPKNTLPHMAIRDVFSAAKLQNVKIYGNTSLAAMVRLCAEGVGIGVIPSRVIGRELDNQELELIDVAGGELPEMSFTVSYMQTPDAHLLQAITELALEINHSI
ncbi:LysR family transcriptional regulator [Hahella ganghwensis]|uniref:LysR family transcriptional regulator n=1 Tax=Hahella ganghwensis TaxID=286420 RepID=UPI000360F8ED|nr:LysR family transcriptional regulator [Hahella ganghwensis]